MSQNRQSVTKIRSPYAAMMRIGVCAVWLLSGCVPDNWINSALSVELPDKSLLSIGDLSTGATSSVLVASVVALELGNHIRESKENSNASFLLDDYRVVYRNLRMSFQLEDKSVTFTATSATVELCQTCELDSRADSVLWATNIEKVKLEVTHPALQFVRMQAYTPEGRSIVSFGPHGLVNLFLEGPYVFPNGDTVMTSIQFDSLSPNSVVANDSTTFYSSKYGVEGFSSRFESEYLLFISAPNSRPETVPVDSGCIDAMVLSLSEISGIKIEPCLD